MRVAASSTWRCAADWAKAEDEAVQARTHTARNLVERVGNKPETSDGVCCWTQQGYSKIAG